MGPRRAPKNGVRRQLRASRVPGDRGARRGGRPAVPVAGAARVGRLRAVHASVGHRAVGPAAAVWRVRRARPVGHAGPGRDRRPPRVGRAATDRVPAAPGAGRGPARLDGRGARAQDAAEAGRGGRRGPGPGAVLPAAVAAGQRLPARGHRRDGQRRAKPVADAAKRGRHVCGHACHAGQQRRPVRVRQHQVRDTDVRERRRLLRRQRFARRLPVTNVHGPL